MVDGVFVWPRRDVVGRLSIGGTMKPGPWVIVALVLLVLSVIISVMDRSFLTPTYLAVLAIAVMLGSGAKFPWP